MKKEEGSPLSRLRHRRVQVVCQGILYQGIFQGADEEVLYLKSLTTYHMLPMERIAAVRLPGLGRVVFKRSETGLTAEFFAEPEEPAEGPPEPGETAPKEPPERP